MYRSNDVPEPETSSGSQRPFQAPLTAPLDAMPPVPYTPPQQPVTYMQGPTSPAAIDWQRRKLKARLGFLQHFAVFFIVNFALFCMWLFLTRNINPYPWFLWATFGWGIGLAIHFYMKVIHYLILETQVEDPKTRIKMSP